MASKEEMAPEWSLSSIVWGNIVIKSTSSQPRSLEEVRSFVTWLLQLRLGIFFVTIETTMTLRSSITELPYFLKTFRHNASSKDDELGAKFCNKLSVLHNGARKREDAKLGEGMVFSFPLSPRLVVPLWTLA